MKKKLFRWRTLWIAVPAVIFLAALYSYISYTLLNVYPLTDEGIKMNGTVYAADGGLYDQFTDGKLDIGGTIGKTDPGFGIDDWLFGITIQRVNGVKGKKAILLQGLMFQDVLSDKPDQPCWICTNGKMVYTCREKMLKDE